MIATGQFVFLHLHKSGGTFVNQWLARNCPSARRIGYHLPRRLIPPELSHLPVIGLVRNPWSYYVSWFAFQSSMEQPNPLFRVLSDDGRLGFEATIRNMVELGAGGGLLDAVVAALPSAYGHRGLNLPAQQLAAIRGSGRGFYSFLYRYMYAGNTPPSIARMEAIGSELPPMIEATGAPLSEKARRQLAERPPVNVSEHRPYAEYYSKALRDAVGECDQPVIERFGYVFGG